MVGTDRTGASRVVTLLEALGDADSASREGLTIAELSRWLGRDRSIVSRQLRPLVELGVVERTESGQHRLGWRLFAIAAKAGDQRLLLLAPPVMRKLTQRVRERCHLSVRRGTDVLTIVSESPQRAIEATGWVGRTVPIHCTSTGRALLFDHAESDIRTLYPTGLPSGGTRRGAQTVGALVKRVDQARKQGFALVDGEFEEDLIAVAAPVRDVHGRIVAALNISAPGYRLRERISTAGRQAAQAAAHLSSALSAPA